MPLTSENQKANSMKGLSPSDHQMILGQSVSKPKPTPSRIELQVAQSQKEKADMSEILRKSLKFSNFFVLEGYSSYSLKITYFGRNPTHWASKMILCFENYIDCTDTTIELSGRCVETPLQLDRENYDLKILLAGEVYREELLIRNSSNKTMRVEAMFPAKLSSLFVFKPRFSFLAPRSEFKFGLRVSIQKKDLELLKRFEIFDQGSMGYKIPGEFIGSQQKLHVHFNLFFRITVAALEIPKGLYFGQLYKNTSKQREFTIHNPSSVLQKLCFDTEHSHIQIEPNLGEISLPPESSIPIKCTFQGTELGNQSHDLRFRVIVQGRSTRRGKIKCKSEVFNCPLDFSTLKLEFPRTQTGEKHSHVFTIQNRSKKSFQLQFIPPPTFLSGLRVFPKTKVLRPHQKVNVTLKFNSLFRKAAFMKFVAQHALNSAEFERNPNNSNDDSQSIDRSSVNRQSLIDLHLQHLEDSSDNSEITNQQNRLDELNKYDQVPKKTELRFFEDLVEYLKEIAVKCDLQKEFSRNLPLEQDIVNTLPANEGLSKKERKYLRNIVKEFVLIDQKIAKMNTENEEKEKEHGASGMDKMDSQKKPQKRGKKRGKQAKAKMEESVEQTPREEIHQIHQKRILILTDFLENFDIEKVNLQRATCIH